MSRGIGAYANKVLEDDENIIYEYGGYNLNEQDFRNENHVNDGRIIISSSCFVKVGMYEKLKEISNGRDKLITKSVSASVEYGKMIENGLIVVENCSNCWHTTEDEKHIDVMALHILFYVFCKYQKEGKIPDYISYNV